MPASDTVLCMMAKALFECPDCRAPRTRWCPLGVTGLIVLSILRSSDAQNNGVLACSFGRPGPITVMFDPTGTGEHWSHVTPVFKEMSTRYTGMVEVEPGRILLVYDSVPFGWDPIPYGSHFKSHASWDGRSRNTIYATFVRVERMKIE